MSEAKECPLCGKPAYTWVHPYDDIHVWASCQNPGCSMNQRNFRLDFWNRRPIEDALRAERDALAEQVKALRGELMAARGEHPASEPPDTTRDILILVYSDWMRGWCADRESQMYFSYRADDDHPGSADVVTPTAWKELE